MTPYTLYVQAAPAEILDVACVDDTVLPDCLAQDSIASVVAVMPDDPRAEAAAARCRSWGVRPFTGDRFNVAHRMVQVWEALGDPDPMIVRILPFWTHIDFDYVANLVAAFRATCCDAALAATDFERTMAADVAHVDALRRIAAIGDDDPASARGRFNPWSYMEAFPDAFHLMVVEDAPTYTKERVAAILASQRHHPENEFIGRDFSGTRYHSLLPHIEPENRVMDIACGSGQGSALFAERAQQVIGVDYLQPYIDDARRRYSEGDRLRFVRGDGATVLPLDAPEQFDVVVSLHTLEHVPDDTAMAANLYRNLRRGGRLIAEVPLQARRPLGVPINPYHLREYTLQQFTTLIKNAGFEIERFEGGCRNIYGPLELARDAVRCFARKPG